MDFFDFFRKIIFYFKNRILSSPILKQNGLNSYHHLQITDNEIKDITPIFKTSYLNYFGTLFITILIEITVALLYFEKHKISPSNLRYIIYFNLATHPILWIISANMTGFKNGNLFGEPLVFIFEALLIYKYIKPRLTIRKSFWLSLEMNLASLIIGNIFYWAATK